LPDSPRTEINKRFLNAKEAIYMTLMKLPFLVVSLLLAFVTVKADTVALGDTQALHNINGSGLSGDLLVTSLTTHLDIVAQQIFGNPNGYVTFRSQLFAQPGTIFHTEFFQRLVSVQPRLRFA
jgi:hypothetical protein